MIRVLTLLVALVLAGGALAQDVETTAPALAVPAEAEPDWATVSASARLLLAAESPSTLALEEMRAQLVEWRETFLTGQDADKGRIDSLTAQLGALGTAPAEGESEDPRLAARRAEINDELDRLRVPVRLASANYTDAQGLIDAIDRDVRSRDTRRLTGRGLSPLNPVNWAPAVTQAVADSQALAMAVVDRFDNQFRVRVARQNISRSLPVAVAGLVLVLLGRLIVSQLGHRVRGASARGRHLARKLLSLGEIVIPLFGVALLASAIRILGFFPVWVTSFAATLPAILLPLFVAAWLRDRLIRDGDDTLLWLTDTQRDRLGGLTSWLGGVVTLRVAVMVLIGFGETEAALMPVIMFPIDAVAAVLLFFIGRTLRHLPQAHDTEDTPVPYRQHLAALVARAVQIIAVVAVALSALGYESGAVALLYPTAGTLALFGVLLVLQSMIHDLYKLLSGKDDSSDALIPVLGGFALSVLALPVLALIWGARVAELTEIWTKVREGFQFGDTRISPTVFFVFIAVFLVGYLLTRLLQGTLRNSVLPKTRMDKGGQNALVAGIGYVGIFLAALVAVTAAGINLSSLAIVAGALSVGLGFGLQNVVSNFVSGIILLIERPISEGDWIDVNGNQGYVRQISVRSTRIETFDRSDVIVPNADFISGAVTNYTRSNTIGRLIVGVGVAYGTDTRRIEALLREIAVDHPMVLANPGPSVFFMGFGDNSLDFEIRAILRDVNFVLGVGSELRHRIAERFAAEGIEIPFPQRDIWVRQSEPPAFTQTS